MSTLKKAKVVFPLALVLMVVVGIAWVKPSLTQAAELTLRYAHIFSPESVIQKGAQKLQEVVSGKSEGRIEVRILPSEQLGNERQIMEGLQMGSIDMAYVSANIVQGVVPIAGITSLGFLIRDFDHAYAVEDGPVGKEMQARIFKKTGVHVPGFNVNGIRVLLSRDKPIRSLGDFKGLRIRVPESPMMVDTFRYLGANPTPIPWGELYTALQTKVVDACEAPPSSLYDVKVFEIGKLCTLTNHSYTGGFLMMSGKAWEKLSEKDRAIVDAGIKESQRFERKLAADAQTKTLEMVKNKFGVKVFPIDTKPLQEAVSPMYKKFAKEIEGGMGLIDQIIKTP